MKRILLAAALAALPLAAPAQGYYYRDRAPVLDRGELRSCMNRDEAHRDRAAALERMKNDLDRESDSLADELRNIDRRDSAAVARYNARSDAHNRRVAELNGAVSMFNGDTEDLNRTCASREFFPQDRDRVYYERIR